MFIDLIARGACPFLLDPRTVCVRLTEWEPLVPRDLRSVSDDLREGIAAQPGRVEAVVAVSLMHEATRTGEKP